MQNELSLIAAGGVALSRLQTNHRTVEQTADFERLAAELEAGPKGRLNPEMHPGWSDLTEANAAYLVVRDRGELVGFCALRAVDVGEDGLSGFLARQFRRLYGAGEDAFEVSGLPPAARTAKGRAAFIGDMFAVPRARIDITALAVLAYTVAAQKWRPDFIYNFTKNKDARRGLAAQYLNLGGYPAAIRWTRRPATRRDDDWLYVMPRETYMWLASVYADRAGDFAVSSAAPYALAAAAGRSSFARETALAGT